jgi:hypothetical protein
LCDTFGIVQELLIVQISWYCMITSLHWVCLLYEATILVYSLLFISVLHVCDEIMIITWPHIGARTILSDLVHCTDTRDCA